MQTAQTPALTFYSFPLSGHAHRVALMLSLLEVPHRRVDVDLRGGEHKRPEFLALNAFGQVPVIDDNGVVVADSTAILVYLAKRYNGQAWLPEDPVGAAAVQRWLSAASGPVAFGPAAARMVTLFGAAYDVDSTLARAHALLQVMDGELAGRAFLAGEAPTIADVACYTYVAHAPEGNVSLDAYPHVRAWLSRIEALPRFAPMPSSPVGLAAA
ncbi:glutathione S-transferase [Achromobacter insolitus]|uniref:Disulfide-bond oxidoreductase YfcG n=1 Tax=Achromobacter insolitus TaxID=217204 RepID=A0A6S7F068_9BURK|nr:glutathione S-transferase [Achromobacter insolitus]GLK94316.1 glutathione S-transferase [Achromobacter xylosoxidans]AXA69342.1 glutathione S-transferase [Achromobacter insolitus]NGT18210.1 glutathione S-transferase [Achromobacter insolitus]OAD16187.1 glutathione S-transferase [Achromobacter insolitus]OAE72699.1 glutathione S-transferase [Achromobacter insolitus]